jgi:dinuclear metal center YbgI/SA1388 family protein
MLTLSAVIDYLERFAPPALAADWDNVGLLLGDLKASLRRVMTCLTLTPATAAEAVEAGAELIVTHHPVLFRPVRRLTAATPEGRVLLDLIRAGVGVYSPHTAFDNMPGGINESLAGRLGLTDLGPLRRATGPAQFKVVVFVPDSDLARVSDAMFAAGAGRIGLYSQCSFRLAGTGTFFGSESTNPAVGQKGRREEVSEWRLEVVCPEACLDPVLRALRRAHSYEEPAFDVYPLRPSSAGPGEGRIGRLAAPLPLKELAQQARDALGARLVQAVGEPDRQVGRLAIVCGAGGEFLPDALRAGADAFLTGEMRFHDYLTAQDQGLALLLPGHYATERFGVEELAARLQQQFPDLQVWAARTERDPVSWVAQEASGA